MSIEIVTGRRLDSQSNRALIRSLSNELFLMIRYLNFVYYDLVMKAFGYTLSVTFILLAGVSTSVAQRVKVESAYYGTRDRSKDVTRRVQRFADYGEPFRVSNDTLRIDPSPNHPKALVVIYVIAGRRISEC